MNDCLFCKIVAEEIPSHKIYEDEKFLAFLDISPINKGHTLVIPKKHSKNILEMEDNVFGELMVLVKKLAKHIKEKLEADGMNIIINNETAAGQIIFHTHIHIIPRFKNDGHKNWNGMEYKNEEIKEIQKTLKLN
ncbi:MAG: HIT family protein [Candidatus Pacebacteria bacterium]|nr:HIT family protein [Candidatus Paceibacterota bacterium]